MDERVMLAWVDKVLKPYVADAPEHVIPILILDSYRCHMMASVVTKIQELGIEVKHIPGGCTSLCQPVDVGFNKPFKDRFRRQWVSWMIAEGVIHSTTSPLTRRDIATYGGDEERGRDHPQRAAEDGLRMVPEGGERRGEYYWRQRGDCLRP